MSALIDHVLYFLERIEMFSFFLSRKDKNLLQITIAACYKIQSDIVLIEKAEELKKDISSCDAGFGSKVIH